MSTETAAAPAVQESTALTVQQRASLALGAPEHEKRLRELATQATEITAIRDKVSYDQVHGTRMGLKRARIAIEQTGKTAREDARAFADAVIAEQKRLIGIIAPEEDRLQALESAHDAEVERKREEAARAERERVERHQAAIRDIRGAIIDVAGRGSAAIEAKIKELVAVEITMETAQEFHAEAEAAREQTLAKLREMHAAAEAMEKERAELDRQRAEQQAEAKRIAEAEAQRLRTIKAEEDAARERIEAQEREARERREAEERRLSDERERIAAAARALEERQREERLAQEERERQERLAAETREREAREAQEAADRAEREQAEAEQRERDDEARRQREAADAAAREEQRQANELLDGREMLMTFVARFGHREEFKAVLKAIDTHLNKRPARAKAAATA